MSRHEYIFRIKLIKKSIKAEAKKYPKISSPSLTVKIDKAKIVLLKKVKKALNKKDNEYRKKLNISNKILKQAYKFR